MDKQEFLFEIVSIDTSPICYGIPDREFSEMTYDFDRVFEIANERYAFLKQELEQGKCLSPALWVVITELENRTAGNAYMLPDGSCQLETYDWFGE
ncbi:hypothetical protein [Brochothrix thermosphacta]|uniref:hypothetical protein n=1 Tax=Brochothrix thermosphacta TaxID=2756 RepID=UPI001C4F155C|nr:hypothetical protein [Brochothrix thermosphacta]